MDINQELEIIHRANGHKVALEKKNLSKEQLFKELVNKNFLVEVMKETQDAVVEYANELESHIETLNKYANTLKAAYDNAHMSNKISEEMFSNFIKTEEALKEITARHHKNIGMMEQKKSFASKGGQARVANSPITKALKEIEQEYHKEAHKFKRHGYGAPFCRKMHDQYPVIEDIKTIQRLVTRLNKKNLPSS